MRTVHVDLNERSYAITIGCDLQPGQSIDQPEGRRALIVTDTNVAPLYADRCQDALRSRGLATALAVVDAGEASKDLDHVRDLYLRAMDSGLDRSSVMVALGGGVIGDLAGFVAATFLRGIAFIQAPTSLLAMVDSSVGGKTGVNLPQGKNLVGAFYQPLEVSADLKALQTLPEREYVAGMAEVVKYGVIWDAELFELLENSVSRLLARDPELMEAVVARCCEIKADVVAVDERESGVRAILNFGHTFGHALEKVAGFGKWLHGEAVAVGMAYAAEVSRVTGRLADEPVQRVDALLKALGLPRSWSAAEVAATWEDVREAMAADKKTRQRIPRFVLADRLGAVVFGCEVPEEVLKEVFDKGCI